MYGYESEQVIWNRSTILQTKITGKSFLKMKADVGISKPKKHWNKIGMIPYQQY